MTHDPELDQGESDLHERLLAQGRRWRETRAASDATRDDTDQRTPQPATRAAAGRRRWLVPLSAAAAVATLAGIGAVMLAAGRDGGETPLAPGASSAAPTDGPTDTPPRLVPAAQADLHLDVSNQSFEDDPVAITVSVDGVTVVDQDFHVEAQHTWVTFDLQVGAGPHRIEVTSDTGASLHRRFVVREGADRYALVQYWYYTDDDEGRFFDWLVQDQPFAYA